MPNGTLVWGVFCTADQASEELKAGQLKGVLTLPIVYSSLIETMLLARPATRTTRPKIKVMELMIRLGRLARENQPASWSRSRTNHMMAGTKKEKPLMKREEMRESRSLKKGMASAMIRAKMASTVRMMIHTVHPLKVLRYRWREFSKLCGGGISEARQMSSCQNVTLRHLSSLPSCEARRLTFGHGHSARQHSH